MKLTALIERQGDGYVSLCPELDVASQGKTIEEAPRQLARGVGAFFGVGFTHRNQATAAGRSIRHSDRGNGWLDCGFFPGRMFAPF